MTEFKAKRPELSEDIAYLMESLQDLRKRLDGYKYNIKEIKACLNVANKEQNEARKQIIVNQLNQTNELLRLGKEDLRFVFSIYKRLKRIEIKK